MGAGGIPRPMGNIMIVPGQGDGGYCSTAGFWWFECLFSFRV